MDTNDNNIKIITFLFSAVLVIGFMFIIANFSSSFGGVVMGGMLFLGLAIGYMFAYMGISLVYSWLIRKGHRVLGLTSYFWGFPSQEEINKMGVGKATIYIYLLQRLDMLVPINGIFFVMLYLMYPQVSLTLSVANLTVEFPIMAVLAGIFNVSFLLYTAMIAFMLYLKLPSDVQPVVNRDDLITKLALEW